MFIKLSLIIFLIWASLVSCVGNDQSRKYWPTEDWRSSKPEKQGLDSDRLKALDSYIKGNLPNLTSLLIVRHGYIVFEQYYEGDRSTLRRLYSVPKSYISCLIGILLQKGSLSSIDEKMMASFAEFKGPEMNPEIENIKIRHLLTMSDGLGSSSVETAIARPLRNEPGKEFLYNEASPQVLSMIITKKTGLKALDYGKKYLFEPLGMSNISWSEKSGYTNGADGLRLTARDLAKLGYLYLNDGVWDNEKIVSSSWVAESTKEQIEVPQSRGWTNAYGFYWWIRNTVGHHAYIAAGYGPQLLYVVPELDLLVVLTTNDAKYPGPPYLPLIDDRIIQAIID